MIIHEPELKIEGEEAVLSARLECNYPVPNAPDHLWFRAPDRWGEFFSLRAESFATAILLTCMLLGENLEIRGAVSQGFAVGFEEYLLAFNLWAPRSFQTIDVQFQNIAPRQTVAERGRVLAAYSGGIDSNFTIKSVLEKHPQGDPYRITHGFFLQGIDYHLGEMSAYRSAAERYDGVFRNLGLELIPLRTNAGLFSQYRISQNWSHGGIIIGSALSLAGGFDKFYLSASYYYRYLVPSGSHPAIDHLLSSEAMEIIHYGVPYSRNEKIKAISDWPPAQKNLRVCTRTPKEMGGKNCGRCSKCYSTKFRMEVIGVKSKFPTLPGRFRQYMFIPWATNASEITTQKNFVEMVYKTRSWKFIPGLLLLWFGYHARNTLSKLLRMVLRRERLVGIKRKLYNDS